MNGNRRTVLVLLLLTALLCAVAYFVASSRPDGLEAAAGRLGFAGKAAAVLKSPFANYEVPFLGSPAGRNLAAGLLGAAVCFAVAFAIGKLTARKERRIAPGPPRPLE